MSDTTRPTLLLVSGASLVAVNVLAALGARRTALRMVATNSVASEPVLADYDEAYLTPALRPHTAAFERRLLEILSVVQPRLVIPCRDDDVLFLAQLHERLPRWQGRFLCGNAATAAALLDKAASWEFSRARALPFAPTVRLDAGEQAVREFAREHGFPLLAKPIEGFASRGVSLLLDANHLARAIGRAGFVLQRYLGDGDAVVHHARGLADAGIPLFHSFESVKKSVQAFIAPDGAVAGVFATFNTMRSGKSERVRVDDDADALAIGHSCAEAFAHAGWRGPLNIQCQRTPAGELLIYEYNGRFTGATAARQLLGYDEVGLALRTFAGVQLVPRTRDANSGSSPDAANAPEPSHRTLGTRATDVVRLPQSRAIDPAVGETLERTGHWRAPARTP